MLRNRTTLKDMDPMENGSNWCWRVELAKLLCLVRWLIIIFSVLGLAGLALIADKV